MAATGNALRERVVDLLVARPDPVAERRDHAEARVLRLEGELEAELVVALAGAAVHDRLGAELAGQLGDRLRDHRARERRDERVLALVERVGLDRLRALLLGELGLPVDEDDVVGAGGAAARDRFLEVELLADVHEHGDDLVVAVPVLLQPADDAARVEAAREGDHSNLAHLHSMQTDYAFHANARLTPWTSRFVDCRPREAYLAGHIPGAAHADTEADLTGTVGGGRHPLPSAESFAAWASAAGIGPDTLVVGYDEGTTGWAPRLWWLLRHFGHDDAAVLSLAAWHGPLRPGVEQLEPAEFVPRPRSDDTAEADELLGRLGDAGLTLVDARAPERWRGEVEPIDPVAGRIPGARNRFFLDETPLPQELLDADGARRLLRLGRDRLRRPARALPRRPRGRTPVSGLVQRVVRARPGRTGLGDGRRELVRPVRRDAVPLRPDELVLAVVELDERQQLHVPQPDLQRQPSVNA